MSNSLQNRCPRLIKRVQMRLYKPSSLVSTCPGMRIYKQFPALLLLTLVLSGCVTASMTNLTPREYPRNAAGLYSVSAAMESDQQTLRWDTIQPNVVVGTETYPMRATALMKNRWETLVPIAASNSVVYFRFKFDFNYTGMGKLKVDSKLSPTYRLEIKDN